MSHSKPPPHGVALDLDTIDRELRQDSQYQHSGHAARTLLRVPDLRVVLLVVKAGSEIAEHRAPGAGSIHVISGHLRVRFPDRAVDVPSGQLLMLEPGLRHAVEASEDSAFVLTLAGRARH